MNGFKNGQRGNVLTSKSCEPFALVIFYKISDYYFELLTWFM